MSNQLADAGFFVVEYELFFHTRSSFFSIYKCEEEGGWRWLQESHPQTQGQQASDASAHGPRVNKFFFPSGNRERIKI